MKLFIPSFSSSNHFLIAFFSFSIRASILSLVIRLNLVKNLIYLISFALSLFWISTSGILSIFARFSHN